MKAITIAGSVKFAILEHSPVGKQGVIRMQRSSGD
jgi:hypothetical protein